MAEIYSMLIGLSVCVLARVCEGEKGTGKSSCEKVMW